MNLPIVQEKLGDGKVINRKIYNGTAYHVETSDSVILVLDNLLRSRQRCRVFFGDVTTGRDWNEEHDILGYVGRSSGNIKIPILVSNERSHGGPALLDHCIVKITVDKKVVYAHPNYHYGSYTLHHILPSSELGTQGYTTSVLRDGLVVANFKSMGTAVNYIAFMQGTRNKI